MMDQLHGTHDNGRAANAPVQTRNHTEHRTAQIATTYVKNRTLLSGNKGQGNTGQVVFERILGSQNNQG